MTTIRNAKKKNVIIAVACCLVLLVGAMSAYFHDTETKSTSAIQADWIKTSTPSAVLSIIEGMEAE